MMTTMAMIKNGDEDDGDDISDGDGDGDFDSDVVDDDDDNAAAFSVLTRSDCPSRSTVPAVSPPPGHVQKQTACHS